MPSLFETCYRMDGKLTDKAERLAVELERNPPAYFDGLHMTLLEGVKPITKVRMPSGEVKEMLMLGSNSFLNLNHHPRVLEAERKAAEKYGVGAGSPPLYAGTTDVHAELERKLAEFCHTEDALIFPAGYSGNIGVLSGLCRTGDAIFCDSSNHASLFDGARLSGAEVIPYLHLNTSHLQLKLEGCKAAGKIIVTDGVFSMEGSLAPVDELVRLKNQHDTMLMVDDAHGFWAVGPGGQGTASLFNCRDEIDIHYGTFSKALGYTGGFAAASHVVIEYLRYYARSAFFSSALPVTVAAGVLEAMKVVEEEPVHLQNLKRNRDFFQNELERRGFDTLNSRSAIIPLLVGDEAKLGALQMALFNDGIFSNIGTTPAVKASRCRLRLNVMATHSLEQLAVAADIIERHARKLGILPEN